LISILSYLLFNRLGIENTGFDLINTSVPRELIMSGGPAKDGIPSLDNPKFTFASNATFLHDTDRVLAIQFQGITKAYPIKIMNYHEVVNDNFNGHAVAITFCPLCRSGIAYSANIQGKKHSFGVSGLLYNSDVLLYDRETESLWSQIMSTAISGALKGYQLTTIPMQNTTWKDWKQQHPNTLVLSSETGYRRDYSSNPYSGYELDNSILFPVAAQDNRYHPKSLVLGIKIDGKFKAYPFSELEKIETELKDEFANQDLVIRYDKQHQNAQVLNSQGKALPSVVTFWFAWYAFHPEGIVFTHK